MTAEIRVSPVPEILQDDPGATGSASWPSALAPVSAPAVKLGVNEPPPGTGDPFTEMFAPPADVTKYDLRPLDPRSPHELSVVKEAAELFQAAELDTITAAFVWREVQAVMAKPLSDAEIELGAARTMADIARRHGDDGAKRLLADARSEVQRVISKRPEVADMLNETGLGNSVWLVERLALKARARRFSGIDERPLR